MRFLVLAALLVTTPVSAQSVVFGGPTQAQIDALQAQITGPVTKLSSIPASGPGAGVCRASTLPSNLISSGGITGTAGTCSTIIQCGTSSGYIVQQFNVGSGC